MSTISRDDARRRFKPGIAKYIFIAESPPQDTSGRFFYFDKVSVGDSLFLETMKVLYPEAWTSCSDVRSKKPQLLQRFCDDGFYLLDAVDGPLGKLSASRKMKRIAENLQGLMQRLDVVYDPKHSRIVLISAPVYTVCHRPLVDMGYLVANIEMIDFPGSGGQRKFRAKLSKILAKKYDEMSPSVS